MKTSFLTLAAGSILVAVAGSASAQIDDKAAQALFKRNDCGKCHAIDKTKKGPS